MRKIIIFSELKDQSTSKVIRWINHLGQDVIRINHDDKELKVQCINEDFIHVKTFSGNYILRKHDVVWFRRVASDSVHFLKGSSKSFDSAFKMFDVLEKHKVHESLISWVTTNCKYIGHPKYTSPNRVYVLLEAQKLGINCPDWIITDNKKDLLNFIAIHKQVVCKSFTHFYYAKDSESYRILTNLITLKELENLPESFNSALFLSYIPKKYELRIFSWKNNFFPMAIFSQQDEKTKIDFREYNSEKPNRNIPVKLDKDFLNKLYLLAKQLKVDTGSFDILVSPEDEYFFLEVNPIGQFGMVSTPCNYNIEKFIADDLVLILNEGQGHYI